MASTVMGAPQRDVCTVKESSTRFGIQAMFLAHAFDSTFR